MNHRHTKRHCFDTRVLLLAFSLIASLGTATRGQAIPQPVLTAVFPMGGKSGSQLDVVVTGLALDGEQRLLFSHPGITASPVMLPADRFYPAPRPAPDRFTVRIAADVPIGTYEVRLSNAQGQSTARAFVVDRLPELLQQQPAYDSSATRRRGRNPDFFAPSEPKFNNTAATAMPASVNSIINGSCTSQLSDYYRFAAQKGDRIILHCTAQLADARTDAVLTLFDTAGNPLQEAHDSVLMDPTLDFAVPQDGEFLVSIHDFLYRGGPEFGYRLAITTGPWIDFIDPPFAAPNGTSQHTIFGRNLPGSQPAGMKGRDGRPLEKLVVTLHAPAEDAAPAIDTLLRPADGSIPTFSYRFNCPGGISNPVRMALSGGSLLVSEGNHDSPESAQPITVPAQIVGTFHSRNQRDWYSFHAHKGEKLWMEVISQRLGLPTDPYVLVQRESADNSAKASSLDVTEGDDQTVVTGQNDSRFRFPNDDPAIPFTAPEDGNYRVLVRDLYSGGQGEPRFFYLLNVRPAQPDFRLQAHPGFPLANANPGPYTAVLRKGGAVMIGILAFRRDGFDGEIRVEAQGLPPGVSADPTVIGPASSVTNLILRAASDASDWDGSIRIVGRSSINGAAVTHIALPAETQSIPVQGSNTAPSRLIQQFALAVRGDVRPPFTIHAEEGKIYRVPRGGKIRIPVTISREKGYSGPVILTALGLHQGIRTQSQQLDIDGSEKTLDLDVDPTETPGKFSFVLRGEARFTYELNPADAKRVADDKTRINAIADQDALNLQKASGARQQADQAAQQAATFVTQVDQRESGLQRDSVEAEQQKQKAERKVADLQAAADASQKALEEARHGADTSATTKAEKSAAKAKAALDQAMLGAADRKQKAQAAVEALTKFASDKAGAQKKSKAAEEERTTAVARETRAKEDARVADEARRVIDDQSRTVSDSARPRAARLVIISPPIVIEVIDAPFTLAIKAATIEIKPGGPATGFRVSIARESSFHDEIRFDLQPPNGAGGIHLSEQNTITGSANDGTLSVQADSGAPAGTFTFKLHAHYKLNSRDLVLERPLELTVLPAEKKK